MNGLKLDRYDLKILRLLAMDGRISKSRLAEEVSLSVSAAWNRIGRLESLGVIKGYRAVIDWNAMVKNSLIIMEVSLESHTAQHMRRFEERMMVCPEITHCYATGGGVDYMLHVQAQSIDCYQRFVDRLLLEDLGIVRYFTYIVTKVVKESALTPIAEVEDVV